MLGNEYTTMNNTDCSRLDGNFSVKSKFIKKKKKKNLECSETCESVLSLTDGGNGNYIHNEIMLHTQ